MNKSFKKYLENLTISAEDRARATELLELMKNAKLKGTYKIQGKYIDGNYFDVVWEKSDIAKFGICFYSHGGDDVVLWRVCYNGKDEYTMQEDLCTDTNDKLIDILKEFNEDNYIVSWTGLFGIKHIEYIDNKYIDKYKNNSKYTIYKF